jgi:hypothetical protein
MMIGVHTQIEDEKHWHSCGCRYADVIWLSVDVGYSFGAGPQRSIHVVRIPIIDASCTIDARPRLSTIGSVEIEARLALRVGIEKFEEIHLGGPYV